MIIIINNYNDVYHLLAAWEGLYCSDDVDGCEQLGCFPGVSCIDEPAPLVGASCGECPLGYLGDGNKCFGKQNIIFYNSNS